MIAPGDSSFYVGKTENFFIPLLLVQKTITKAISKTLSMVVSNAGTLYGLISVRITIKTYIRQDLYLFVPMYYFR